MSRARAITMDVHTLRQLMVASELMAVALDGVADDLDEACGVDDTRTERVLPRMWHQVSDKVKRMVQGCVS